MKRIYFIVITSLLLIVPGESCIRNNNADAISKGAQPYRNTDHLILTRHVKCRMDCRHINITEIKKIINDGKVNYAKSGKGSKGDETYALEGYSNDQEHLRVVVAPEDDGLVVITCIDLDKEWPCNCD